MKELYSQKAGKKKIKYTFTTYFPGEYQICVQNEGKSPISPKIKIASGVDAKDYSLLPNKSELRGIKKDLLVMKDTAVQLKAKLKFIIQSEEDKTDNIKNTYSQVILYGCITIAMSILTAGL